MRLPAKNVYHDSSFDNTLGPNVIEQNLYGETLDESVNIKVSTKALDS